MCEVGGAFENYNVEVVGLLTDEKLECVIAVGSWKLKGNHTVEGTALPAFAEVVRKMKKGEWGKRNSNELGN